MPTPTATPKLTAESMPSFPCRRRKYATKSVHPVTNPTSTVIFKCLIAAKTRNPLILSPHGGAKKSSRAAARVCYEAALEAGAPEDAIQWMRRSHKDALQAVMSHPKLALIVATGTGDVVSWAQRSGNPVLGVGPGNVPVLVDASALPDVERIVRAHGRNAPASRKAAWPDVERIVATHGA